MEAANHRTFALRPEPVADDPGPHPTSRPELGDLLEQLGPGGEKERQPTGEVVDRQAAPDRGLAVGDRVGKREGKLLGCSRARLPHVVAGDRDRVPTWELGGTELEDVGNEAHRWAGRKDPRPAGDVLLEDVVLGRPRDPLPRDAALLGSRDV